MPALPSSSFEVIFQSTLPARGSDCRSGFHLPLLHISIHAPPHGERRGTPAAYVHGLYFNPRSPHGERRGTSGGVCPRVVFQSTLPARGATGFFLQRADAELISIHAPRTGSDPGCRFGRLPASISIHAPRTGSDVAQAVEGHRRQRFQSTLPRTGSDVCVHLVHTSLVISIHAPRTGSDATGSAPPPAQEQDFNPRSPHGGATTMTCNGHTYTVISIHASPHGERQFRKLLLPLLRHFNPRSPHGERLTPPRPRCRCCCHFNPRSPHGERPNAGMAAGRNRMDFNPRSPARGATRMTMCI